MSELASRACVPCHGGVPRLRGVELEAFAREVPAWSVEDEHHLRRAYKFNNFDAALAFVNRVGALAETEGHHPDLHLSHGSLRVDLWTHAAGGLTENDFVLAAKIDRIRGL